VDGDTKQFFERLYTAMYGKLFTYAYSVFKDAYRSQDLVHETFTIALGKIDSVKKSPNPEGWLVNALKNVVMHELRDSERLIKLMVPLDSPDEWQLPEALVYNGADNMGMEDIKASLPADEWRLLNDIYLEGKTYAELAGELGIGYDACRKRVRKARDKAARLLGDEGAKI
jgi:RNA polymerase sigma factor (sigma-70 family)